jgi:methionine synthase I (cobalamin-dependent)
LIPPFSENAAPSRYVAGRDYPDPAKIWMIDGGMGSEIQAQNPDSIVGEAWSGMAQLKDPPLVQSIHVEYLKAGADIVIANSYASNAHVLGHEASGEEEVKQCSTAACALAFSACSEHRQQDREAADRRFWVAGSISTHPPYSLMAIDSDEYKDNHDAYNLTDVAKWPEPEVELENYRKQARALKEGNVDFIVLEMMKDVDHAMRACTAAVEAQVTLTVMQFSLIPSFLPWPLPSFLPSFLSSFLDPFLPSFLSFFLEPFLLQVPIFLGITVKVENGAVVMRDDPAVDFGETVRGLVKACGGNCVAINIMHSPVDEILPAIAALRKVHTGPIGVYPNNARSTARLAYNAEDGYTDEEYAQEALKWAKTGFVSYIGGCCGTKPSHIAAARKLLTEEGFFGSK